MPYREKEQDAAEIPKQESLRRVLSDPANELLVTSILTFGGGIALGQLSDRYDLSTPAALTLLFLALVIIGLWLHAAYRTLRHYFL